MLLCDDLGRVGLQEVYNTPAMFAIRTVLTIFAPCRVIRACLVLDCGRARRPGKQMRILK